MSNRLLRRVIECISLAWQRFSSVCSEGLAVLIVAACLSLLQYKSNLDFEESLRTSNYTHVECLFLELDYAQFLLGRYIAEHDAVPEGELSYRAFVSQFQNSTENKKDPYGLTWQMKRARFSKDKMLDPLLEALAPHIGGYRNHDGQWGAPPQQWFIRSGDRLPSVELDILWEEFAQFDRKSTCFFGKSAISDDYAYIGFRSDWLMYNTTYATILASYRKGHYFSSDKPEALFNGGNSLLVYIKTPKKDMAIIECPSKTLNPSSAVSMKGGDI